jgi:hypothetical protein
MDAINQVRLKAGRGDPASPFHALLPKLIEAAPAEGPGRDLVCSSYLRPRFRA